MRKKAIAVFIDEKKGRPVWMQVSLGRLSFENGHVKFEEHKLLQSIPYTRKAFEETHSVAKTLCLDRYVKRESSKHVSLTLPQWEEQPELF